jgi:hypothetical protein
VRRGDSGDGAVPFPYSKFVDRPIASNCPIASNRPIASTPDRINRPIAKFALSPKIESFHGDVSAGCFALL